METKLEEYIRVRSEPKSGKYRTVNIDEEMHLFLKRTANHYNIALSDLMYNILIHWKSEYQQKIMEDIVKQLGK